MTSRVSPRYSINKRGVEQHAKTNQLQAITKIKIKEISIMSNLFTAVSVENQEIVAGGVETALFATRFRGRRTIQGGLAASGFDGSIAEGGQANENVRTNALTLLRANAPFPG
jgi:hypothetical protein